MNPSPLAADATQPVGWSGLTVELVHADLYPCAPGWGIAPMQLAYAGLFYIWKGRGWVEQDGTRLDALPGDLFFLRPGMQFAAGHDRARPVTVLSTGFRLAAAAGGDPLLRWRLPARLRLPRGHQAEFSARFNTLVQDRQAVAQTAELAADPATTLASGLSARGSVLRLLAEALRLISALPTTARAGELAGRPGDAARVTAVLDFIDAHMAEPLTVERLAKVAHLSTVHFAAVFRKETGQPPMAYVRSRRIERARSLLAAGDRSVAQIARAVGFGDPFHFSRAFRRLTGLAPRAYRSALKNPFQP